MSEFGVTPAGFVVKPLGQLLDDTAARARDMFGPDADLRPTSALGMVLKIAAAEDHELWKLAGRLYASGFVSTASGDALNLLGDDVGVERAHLPARGKVKFTITTPAPGRLYHLPLGTLVETAAGELFRTLARVTLSDKATEAVAEVEAREPGPDGNVPAGAITAVNPEFAGRFLSLGTATVAVTNDAPTAGGDEEEGDEAYRARLLTRPRTLWTLDAVRAAVLAVDGVRDARLFDPLGGVDVSLSRFRLFQFGRRAFGTRRVVGSPYFFDVLVAVRPGFRWDGPAGVRDAVAAAVRPVRPVSVFPNLRQANDVPVGVRAKLLIRSGHDAEAVRASAREALDRRVGGLGLGTAVLYSDVVCDLKAVPGVIDVQGLHLRRSPPQFGTVGFGRSPRFQAADVEMAVGENLSLAPDEIAVFRTDSKLLDVRVGDR